MYQCELISVKRKNADAGLSEKRSELDAVCAQNGAQLNGIGELNADPKRITRYVSERISDDKADLFVFTDALDSSGADSFRRLFYDLIASLEKSVQIDKEHKGLRPRVKVSSMGDLGGAKGYCFSFGGRRFLALPQASLTDRDPAALLTDAFQRADEVFAGQRERYPEGIAFVDAKGNEADPALNRISSDQMQPAKKQGFWASLFPQKGDSSGLKARKIAVLVAIVAFIGAGIYVLNFYVIAPMRNNAITSEIQQIAYNAGDGSGDGENGGSAQDWNALKKVNKEIVGWITIPKTVVDYPVLEHKGDDRYNQYYLERSYKKDGTEYGSIFLDYRSTDSVKSRNVIMHGHNMRDGSQFHSLLSYSHEGSLNADLDYYREHPVIIFNTPDGDAKYKIISIFKTSTRYEDGEFFNYMQGEFNSDAEFMNFVYNMRIRSMVNVPVTCNEGDQIITLSTCCYEFYQWRCVVVARKVRPGEDPGVDVKLATLNSSPLFPEAYYERYGGTRPDPGTFKKANAKGKVGWYDGTGKLEGSEDLTATIASNPTEPPTEKPKPGATVPTEPPAVTYYSVIFRNSDGSQYAAFNVKEGDPLPIPSGTPGLPHDDYYDYTFAGWNLDIPGVDTNSLHVGLDIYPKVEAKPKE